MHIHAQISPFLQNPCKLLGAIKGDFPLEMRPFIEEFKASELPERMPDWAKVNGNSDSSDDEFQANTRYAKECGDRLLQKILYQK